MKFLILLFSLNSMAQPIDPKFYEKRRKVRVLTNYLDSIQGRYWNVIQTLTKSEKNFRGLLSKYNFILKIHQKYVSECSENIKFECENIFFEMMDSLDSLYQNFTKLEKRLPDLEFMTLEILLKVQLLFVEYEVKKTSLSVRERYKVNEELKTYVRGFFTKLNKLCPNVLRNPNYDFWKNFITQSHFLLAKTTNLQFLPQNFRLMNKSMYGLIYSIQNAEKIDKNIANDIQAMNSQWNFIQKNLYKYERRKR